MIRRINTQTAHNAITSATLSEKFLVEDCRHLVLEEYLVGATFVTKVKVSNAEDVDFSAASTVANPWYYVDLKGLGDGATSVTGSTGITGTTVTAARAYAINVDVAKWVAVDVQTLSAGSASYVLTQATNE
jgi:hypothetical protein